MNAVPATPPSTPALRPTGAKLVRFIMVGGGSTAAYAAMAGLGAIWWPAWRQALGVFLYAAMVPLAFAAHKRFVFQSPDEAGAEFLRYLVLQLVSITGPALLLPRLATGGWLWNAGLYGATAVAGAGVNFVLCNSFVFRLRRIPADEMEIAAKQQV